MLEKLEHGVRVVSMLVVKTGDWCGSIPPPKLKSISLVVSYTR